MTLILDAFIWGVALVVFLLPLTIGIPLLCTLASKMLDLLSGLDG